MKKRDTYNTYAVTVSPFGITKYCYNENLISIEEFVTIENKAFISAMDKRWKIFKHLETFKVDILIGLN